MTDQSLTADFVQDSWCGLEWTPFISFSAARPEFQIISDGPGLYRVWLAGSSVLAYVGQTGRNLRERVSALVRHSLAEEMPFNDPHTAAPRLWTYRIEQGALFEVSTAPCSLAKPSRMALESFLIWKYRQSVGESPMCNFGRLHRSYSPSRNRSTSIRGKRLPDEEPNPNNAASLPALGLHGWPTEASWMSLEWSRSQLLATNEFDAVPNRPGVYRLIGGTDVIYCGESSKLKDRLRGHAKQYPNTVNYSYVVLPEANAKCQRLEIENDLIAGHFASMGNAPANQFGERQPTG